MQDGYLINVNGNTSHHIWPKYLTTSQDFINEYVPQFLGDVNYRLQQSNDYMAYILKALNLQNYTGFAVFYHELIRFFQLFLMAKTSKYDITLKVSLPTNTYTPVHNLYKASLLVNNAYKLKPLEGSFDNLRENLQINDNKNGLNWQIVISPIFSYLSGALINKFLNHQGNIIASSNMINITDITQIVGHLMLLGKEKTTSNPNFNSDLPEIDEKLLEYKLLVDELLGKHEGSKNSIANNILLVDSSLLGILNGPIFIFIKNSIIPQAFFEFWEKHAQVYTNYNQINQAFWLTDWRYDLNLLSGVYSFYKMIKDIRKFGLSNIRNNIKGLYNFYQNVANALGTNEPLYLRPQNQELLYSVSLKLPLHFASSIYKSLVDNFILPGYFYKDSNSVYLTFTPVLYNKIDFDEVFAVLDSLL